jgi:NitT/TauT family transport system substrate-binding protein
VSRRGLLRAGGVGLTGAGAALLFGCGDDGPKPLPTGPEPPPEVTRVRFPANGDVCVTPIYLAAKFLAEEGFTDVQYLPDVNTAESMEAGSVDFGYDFPSSAVTNAERKVKFTVLAGIHAGCMMLFAIDDDIRTVSDLRGKKVGVGLGDNPTYGDYAFMSTLLQFVGIPTDHTLVSYPAEQLPERLKNGDVDAVLTIPPTDQLFHAANITRVILESSTDAPWSQYYCCMLEANTHFVASYPVATKRVLRAVLKAADLCASDPESAASYVADQGHLGQSYETTLAAVKHLPYGVWRRYDPGDTIRFYGLRLRDAGAVKIKPGDVIRRNTDWRFLNELKEEMAQTAFAPHPASSGFALNCEVGPVEAPAAAAKPRPDDGRATGTT